MKHKANKFSDNVGGAAGDANPINHQIKQADELFNDLEETEIFNKKYTADWAEGLLDKDNKWIDKKKLLEEFTNFTKSLKIQKSSGLRTF
jgi:hypothetical protein